MQKRCAKERASCECYLHHEVSCLLQYFFYRSKQRLWSHCLFLSSLQFVQFLVTPGLVSSGLVSLQLQPHISHCLLDSSSQMPSGYLTLPDWGWTNLPPRIGSFPRSPKLVGSFSKPMFRLATARFGLSFRIQHSRPSTLQLWSSSLPCHPCAWALATTPDIFTLLCYCHSFCLERSSI